MSFAKIYYGKKPYGANG